MKYIGNEIDQPVVSVVVQVLVSIVVVVVVLLLLLVVVVPTGDHLVEI